MGGAEKVGFTENCRTDLRLRQKREKNALTVVTTPLLRIGSLALAMLFFMVFARADMRPPVPECSGASVIRPQSPVSRSQGSVAGLPQEGVNGAMCKLPTH